MSVNFSAIIDEVNKFTKELNAPKQTVPPMLLPTKSVDEEVKDELEKPPYKHQTEDAKFITKCYKYLRKLGLVESQYQFSKQFLNKNNCANKKCLADNFYA